ncbi:lambda-exonuclease family protein [Vibrio sp. 10N.222.54.A1]|uniref:lambda-exonuclease family protein n=1 Tax=unclassified Vibrio TaxID=2614977 RepID=UPI00354D9D2C
MAIIDLVQRSEEWFAWRKTGITASMIPVILGKSPYQTPYQLWAELVGLKEPDDLSNNFHVQRGVAQEPEARNAVETEYGKPYMPVCVQADHNPLFLASLDGLYRFGQESEVLEIKCPHEKIYNEILQYKGQAPTFQMYLAQVQWQLNCANAKQGRLYFYLRGKRPISVGIPRDDAFIEQAEEAALVFWNLVQTKTPPPRIEGRDKVVYDNPLPDNVWVAKANEYKEKKAYHLELAAKADAVKDDLKELESFFTKEIPDDAKTFEKEGIRATKVEREGSVNTQALISVLEQELNVVITQEIINKAKGKGSSYFKVSVDENADKVKVEQSTLEAVTKPTSIDETTETIVAPKMVSLPTDLDPQPLVSAQTVEDSQTTQQEPTEYLQPLMPQNNFFEKSKSNMHF